MESLPSKMHSHRFARISVARYPAPPLRNFGTGFSLVEMLFYVGILAIALVVVTQVLIFMTRSYGLLRTAEHIEQHAALALERMAREIRDAEDILDAESVFDTHPGSLTLQTETASGTPRTVSFYLDNGALILKEDTVVTGRITGGETAITNLVFKKITTARSKGVRIEMTLEAGAGSSYRTTPFYMTAVLRNSY